MTSGQHDIEDDSDRKTCLVILEMAKKQTRVCRLREKDCDIRQ